MIGFHFYDPCSVFLPPHRRNFVDSKKTEGWLIVNVFLHDYFDMNNFELGQLFDGRLAFPIDGPCLYQNFLKVKHNFTDDRSISDKNSLDSKILTIAE